jgi:hypothetical protein
MYDKLKISQHAHSGRLRPHEHTSYIPLFLMIALVGAVLITLSFRVLVTAAPPGPEASSVGLTGTMPAKPPETAATITTPKAEQHFSTSPITVAGTCPTKTLVEIFKNNIFAGSSPCEEDGTYSLQIDLLYGKNVLTAQVYDVLNQAGPVSNPVTVYYDAVQPINPALTLLNFGASQLLLNTDAVYRGAFPGQMLNVPISIIGGAPPFAVNVLWGDTNNKVIPRGDNTIFNAAHAYQKAGTYKVTFQASDSQQQVAFLTVAAIINGQPAVIGSTNGSGTQQGSKSLLNKLLVLWPLYTTAFTLVVSFWFGERHQKKIMQKIMAAQQNPSLGITPHSPV